MVPADVSSVAWELECSIATTQDGVDLTGPLICGSPSRRFIYLSWGVVDESGVFTMFRRAKLSLHLVPPEILSAAQGSGLLVGRLGLSDDDGWPLCAAVRPPRIAWSAAG